jgi:hypothetical protein
MVPTAEPLCVSQITKRNWIKSDPRSCAIHSSNTDRFSVSLAGARGSFDYYEAFIVNMLVRTDGLIRHSLDPPAAPVAVELLDSSH